MPDDLEPAADTLPTSPELVQLMENAVARHEAAENENTARSYEAGWHQFGGFCETHGFRALPANPQSVTLFVEQLATEGYAVSTIDARLSAIAHYHAEAGLKNPCTSQPVRRQKKNVRRTTDSAPDQKAPVLMKHLRQMVFDGGELRDLRDRALLFVGFAGGFRRSELTALTVGDVREVPGGRVIRLRRSKTDQEGRGRLVQIPDRVALEPTPNEALEQWLGQSGISSGPLFRGVDRWGNVRDSALSGQAVYAIVRQRMESIGEDPGRYGAHSLRAGYATQGYLDGIGEHEIAEQTGHAKLDTLRSYQRVNVVLESHPLSRMGLEE